MKNGLLPTSRQRHAEYLTLTAMECHGCVDSAKSEHISLIISVGEPELQNDS